MSTAQLPTEVSITEREERVIQCPQGIEEQLKQAAFEQVDTNVFVKRRRSWDGESEYKVVEARLDGDELTISAEDIVGIVDLTPTSRLQIRPRIGWSEILDMFLTVSRYNRSLDYQGIPIRDFLSEDVQIEDVFIVIAVNFLNSLAPLHRNGFIRQFETQRTDAVDARGRIDVERSLLNLETGIPKQHYVQKEVDYNTPINALIHRAGKSLLQLFQKSARRHNREEYFRIFSDLNNAVHELESMGIKGDGHNLSEYQQITSGQLPRHRGYYKRAIEVSKMILSSTTGQSLESGDEELTMDYLFNMANLFEEFSQIVLVEELSKLESNPLYDGFDDARVEGEPQLRPYVNTNQAWHQPDHVLYKGDEPVAVLDSKYYPETRDPSMIRPDREQIFSYAYLLDVDRLGFLCPEGNGRRNLRAREGEVAIIGSRQNFTTESYRDAIRSYLLKVLEDEVNESQLIADFRNHTVCHPDVKEISVEEALTQEIFELEDIVSLSRSIFEGAISESDEVRVRRDLSKDIQFSLRRSLKKAITDHAEYDQCIPVFIDTATTTDENEENGEENNQWVGESLRLHFVKVTDSGDVAEFETIDSFPLDWEKDRDDPPY
ncbi:5-methylcytosine restriction system specificity protein McrC [Haloterrigena salifodinae]|uniref:5-methylcytosine restriction system specificity protein McrC n=1 Tax=Haloterrigena salifodinae TaxID=2675099 RepID=UPI000F89A911|nr:hypothetical protein [Haloterrigena salifodinae]